MSIASDSSQSCAGFGHAKEAGSGLWCDRVINGCTSMALLNRRAEKPRGYSCLRSIHKPFLWSCTLSQKNKGSGQTNRLPWFWIKPAGTRAVISACLKDCTCSFCHHIRLNCNQPSACGRSPMSRSLIGPFPRLTNWNRCKPSGVVGSKLIQKSFGVAPPFTGGLLLWTLLKRI